MTSGLLRWGRRDKNEEAAVGSAKDARVLARWDVRLGVVAPVQPIAATRPPQVVFVRIEDLSSVEPKLVIHGRQVASPGVIVVGRDGSSVGEGETIL